MDKLELMLKAYNLQTYREMIREKPKFESLYIKISNELYSILFENDITIEDIEKTFNLIK